MRHAWLGVFIGLLLPMMGSASPDPVLPPDLPGGMWGYWERWLLRDVWNAYPGHRVTGVSAAPDGTTYWCDADDKVVWKQGPAGLIKKFAGTPGVSVPWTYDSALSGDGGPASAARFFDPSATAVGPDGSVYIGDRWKIRKVHPDGTITTLAGFGGSWPDGDEAILRFRTPGPAAQTWLPYVHDLAMAPDGILYVNTLMGIQRITTQGEPWISPFVEAGSWQHSPTMGTIVTTRVGSIDLQKIAVNFRGEVHASGGPHDSITIGGASPNIYRFGPDGMPTIILGCDQTSNIVADPLHGVGPAHPGKAITAATIAFRDGDDRVHFWRDSDGAHGMRLDPDGVIRWIDHFQTHQNGMVPRNSVVWNRDGFVMAAANSIFFLQDTHHGVGGTLSVSPPSITVTAAIGDPGITIPLNIPLFDPMTDSSIYFAAEWDRTLTWLDAAAVMPPELIATQPSIRIYPERVDAPGTYTDIVKIYQTGRPDLPPVGLPVTVTFTPGDGTNRGPFIHTPNSNYIASPGGNIWHVREDSSLSLPLVGADDGLPAGSLTWSVSGAVHGAAEIGDGVLKYTPVPGYHSGHPMTTWETLMLKVSDGALEYMCKVFIYIDPLPDPPVVSAGPDLLVTLPGPLTLQGVATDPDLVTTYVLGTRPQELVTRWSMVLGPGGVSFDDPSSPSAGASFHAPGTYVLRFTASDGWTTVSDDVVVTAQGASAGNVAPIALDDYRIVGATQPTAILLRAIDDGQLHALNFALTQGPGHGTLQLSGGSALYVPEPDYEGTVSFAFQVDDGAYVSAPATVTLSLVRGYSAGTNTAPVVDAGPDQQIGLGSTVLQGSASDAEGHPLTIRWSSVSGPVPARFSDATLLTSSVDLAIEGSYVLRLEVSDGVSTVSDEVTIERPAVLRGSGGGGGGGCPAASTAGSGVPWMALLPIVLMADRPRRRMRR